MIQASTNKSRFNHFQKLTVFTTFTKLTSRLQMLRATTPHFCRVNHRHVRLSRGAVSDVSSVRWWIGSNTPVGCGDFKLRRRQGSALLMRLLRVKLESRASPLPLVCTGQNICTGIGGRLFKPD
ncbi:hypothetical protein CLF_106312 [Clonorchis sinensis]|uniref:Uncharacterized protein n=1 Tax=Clonorchis sinensis TaxID=79923 RepID=G7YPW2_CLOSI|nr:hypothetical protein CLF_106312 [Clonorchis sinensis]